MMSAPLRLSLSRSTAIARSTWIEYLTLKVTTRIASGVESGAAGA
jgi:hypothetical protein